MKKNLIAGVSFGFSGIEAVICDEDFEIIHKVSKPYPGQLGKESLVVRIAKTLSSLKDFHLCYAVGIALPAVFDSDNQKVIESGIDEIVGENIAKSAIAKGIKKVVFDRSGYQYHGVVKTVADTARKHGLEF